MKTNKIILTLIIGLLTSMISAQVGIGTTTPAATADITALNPTGGSTNVDGLLIPRVNRQRARTMTGIPTSTLIYVNSINSTQTLQAINIDTVGFYYFDGAVWQKLTTTNNDWTLVGNTGTVATTNFLGTTDAVDFITRTNNLERTRITSAGNMGVGSLTPSSKLSVGGNLTVGTTFAPANIAPTNGLRVQGQSVIGKASGEDSRDMFSAHNSTTAYQNITGYPNNTAARAISGYANGNGIGVFGFANRTGYGVVGLTNPSVISSFVQTGEGVLGQSSGASGVTIIPIGVHGIIDEASAGLLTATPVLGENNNITRGTGLGGGAYNSSTPAASAVYGNFATRSTPQATDSYQFGVVGDILLLGVANQPDATGGVLGTNAAGDFGILGYKSRGGTFYSGYFGNVGGVVTGTGKTSNTANGNIGLGVNGGFMGGYVKGSKYGMITQGEEFGMYVQGNTITNKPIVQLSEGSNSNRTVTYTATSTEVDVTTRGTGKLQNGTSFISYKEAFKSLVAHNEGVNITITPTGETNGVFISKVTSEGFYVKENLNGNSNASFNWTAIGTRKGYENGIELSNVVLSNNFDEKMNAVMTNENATEEPAPIHYDGNSVKFERIPDGFVKYNTKKENPKK